MSSIQFGNLVKQRLRSLLNDAPRAEFEQSVLRVAVPLLAIVALCVVWAWKGSLDAGERTGLAIAIVFFVAAAALMAHILFKGNDTNVSARRILGIVADNAVNTYFMLVMDEGGAVVLGVYLFVTFGNGFRYGRLYLHLSQAFAVAGFSLVLVLSEFWSKHLPVGIGVLVAMLVLPFYVGVLAQRITEAKRRADEANQAKGRFLANVSHEMRTPLNGVIAMADLLRETKLHDSQVEIVETLSTSAQLALSQIEDVLDAAKIEAGRVRIDALPFDMGKLLKDTVKVVLPQARYKGLSISIDACDGVDSWFLGDAHHLRQVLLNLLSNAVKFTEKGGIVLRTRVIRTDSECAFVRVEVEDTGVGIPKNKLNTIFEAFAQADDSITRVYGGTGLGTTIARQLVLLMGGKIGVESTENKGSTFWFELPLHFSKVQDSDFAAAEIATRSATLPGRAFAINGTTVTRIRGARVLVAEDNVTNQRVTQLILESRGHDATIVANGEAALDALERGQFDIALFDLSMPVLSGLEALKMYRFAELNPIPIIILSANVTTEVISECTRAGASEFVAKPVRASVLLDAIERQLADRFAVRAVSQNPDERPILSVVDGSPIDPSVMRELTNLSRDETFVERLLLGFSDDCTRLVDQIAEDLAARRYEAAKDAAHALKGGAGGIGATQLVIFSTRLQKLTHDEIRGKASSLMEELRRLRDETLFTIERIVKENRLNRQRSSGTS